MNLDNDPVHDDNLSKDTKKRVNRIYDESLVRCPKCHLVEHHIACMRQGFVKNVGNIIDVGWKCSRCNKEWGFKYFTEEVWSEVFGESKNAND